MARDTLNPEEPVPVQKRAKGGADEDGWVSASQVSMSHADKANMKTMVQTTDAEGSDRHLSAQTKKQPPNENAVAQGRASLQGRRATKASEKLVKNAGKVL